MNNTKILPICRVVAPSEGAVAPSEGALEGVTTLIRWVVASLNLTSQVPRVSTPQLDQNSKLKKSNRLVITSVWLPLKRLLTQQPPTSLNPSKACMRTPFSADSISEAARSLCL